MGDIETVLSDGRKSGAIVCDALSSLGLWLGLVGIFDVVSPPPATGQAEGVFIRNKQLEQQMFIGTGVGLIVGSQIAKGFLLKK